MEVMKRGKFLLPVVLAACAGRPELREAAYRFKEGEVLACRAETSLHVDMRGTHEEFLPGDNDQPFTWSVGGEFENRVSRSMPGKSATIERRVRRIDSRGRFREDEFQFTWSRDQGMPDESKLTDVMDRYIAHMISTPATYSVDAEGHSKTSIPELHRLVARLGMMTWPVRAAEVSWSTIEEIVVPLLHDKVKVEFKNSIVGGSDVRRIHAVAILKEEPKPVMHPHEIAFTVSGEASAEFDLRIGRLQSLDLALDIGFSGRGELSTGGHGPIKGLFSYRERQRLLAN